MKSTLEKAESDIDWENYILSKEFEMDTEIVANENRQRRKKCRHGSWIWRMNRNTRSLILYSVMISLIIIWRLKGINGLVEGNWNFCNKEFQNSSVTIIINDTIN